MNYFQGRGYMYQRPQFNCFVPDFLKNTCAFPNWVFHEAMAAHDQTVRCTQQFGKHFQAFYTHDYGVCSTDQ